MSLCGRFRPLIVAVLLAAASSLSGPSLFAQPVEVRYPEGVSRGFLRLLDDTGKLLAEGENTQRPRGARIVSRLVFRFIDGSVYDETTVFTQRREFRLVTEHLVQRGPAFPQPTDLFIDAQSGNVTVRYREKGEEKVASEHLDLPADVANGIVQMLLKNIGPKQAATSFSYVAANPKPRLVKLLVSVAGRDRFTAGRTAYRAIHYVLKVDIGGIKGTIASVLGKTPPDSHVWIVDGEAPAFVRAEQPFFADGPVWRIELVAPRWGEAARSTDSR